MEKLQQKLIMMKGLPGSGKTTAARKLVEEGFKRVNRDDLRLMIDDLSKGDRNYNSKYKKNEPAIKKLQRQIVATLLDDGFSVVIDDTNLAAENEKRYRELAATYEVDFEVLFIDTPLQECIKRDLARPDSVGEKVIMRMYRDNFSRRYKPPVKVAGLPNALVVDIDGTLAHGLERSPYDPSLYHLDTLDETIAELVNRYRLDHKIILCTGRQSEFRVATMDWLLIKGFSFDALYMRAEKDKRSDVIVKKELYINYIKEEYNVTLVIEDRPRVVDMWQSLGLRTLSVNLDYWYDF